MPRLSFDLLVFHALSVQLSCFVCITNMALQAAFYNPGRDDHRKHLDNRLSHVGSQEELCIHLLADAAERHGKNYGSGSY